VLPFGRFPIPTGWVGAPAVAARLLRHAYALTMANAHVLLGYPLLAIPEPSSFVELTRLGSTSGITKFEN
jgi:hypothetical protein